MMTVENIEAWPSHFVSEFQDCIELERKAETLDEVSDVCTKLSSLTESLISHLEGNQLHHSLGKLWLIYGRALMRESTMESNNILLGQKGMSKIEKAAKEKESELEESLSVESTLAEEESVTVESTTEVKEVIETEKESITEEESNINDQVPEDSAIEKEEDESDEDSVEEEGEDANGSDFEAAWDALETSRVIYSNLPKSNETQKQLCEIHSLLGDISLEEEKFEEAVKEFSSALDIQKSISMNIHDDRIIAELNYKLALSYEFLMQWKESLESLAETKKILETRIENLKNQLNAGISVKGKGKAIENFNGNTSLEQELKDLNEILIELNDKVDDINNNLRLKKTASDPVEMLRAIIDRPEKPKEPVQSNTFSFGSSAISGFKPISAPTHDLSAMVKKKVSSPVKVIPTSVKRSAEEESICLEKKAKHEDTVEA